MRLAAAALDRGWRFVLVDQGSRHFEAAVCEFSCTLGQFLRVGDDADVVFHVLMRPAARVGDVGELREDVAQFAEEAEHLTGHRLDVVLPPR